MSYLKKFNFNPWGANVGDCAIRAIVAAIGMDYRKVCRRLGFSWKNGRGLIRDSGTDLNRVKEVFDEYFDIVEDFEDAYDVTDDLVNDRDFDTSLFLSDENFGVTGITLEEFIDLYRDQGLFLVGLQANPDAKNHAARDGGHIVAVNCQPGTKPYFIDSWDSSEMLVDSYMRVKKRLPANHPDHWVYDKQAKKFVL